jgi:hypothetical protein
MILVKTYKQDNDILEISIEGHANYKDYGNDIVCAAVSSISLCTVNAILSFDNHSIEVKENSGYLEITVLKQDNIIRTLLNNMLRCLQDIEIDYPTNIKLSKEE